jgi:hypothetical protein
MMRFLVILMLILCIGPAFAQEFEETPRELYMEICAQCHELKGYVWDRSFKSWQACVYRMQAYAGPGGITDAEADIIVDFLT